MRSVRWLAFLLCLGLAASSCGGGSSGSGRVGTVGLADDGYILEGPSANVGFDLNITETLVSLGPDYEVQPALAERWEFRSPGTWRFFLQRDVRFHDGQPLDARAVKSGLFDRAAAFGGGTIASGPESATIVDQFTIDFTPTQPNLRVPQQLVHPLYGVIAPGSDPGKPVGTGPLRFVEHVPKERLIVERNDDYWASKAKADRITFRFYPDNEVRRLALEAGDIDLATQLRPSDANQLKAKGLVVVTSPVGSYDALYANIHRGTGILADRRVRQAVAHGIDRMAIVGMILEGMATTDASVVPRALLYPHDSLIQGYAFDPPRARALLEEAGWGAGPDGVRRRGGRRLQLTLVSGAPSAEAFRPLAEFVQSQLGDIGVFLDIVERPDLASYQELVATGEGDLYLEQGSQNDGDPAFLPSVLFYSGSSAEATDYQALFAPGGRFDELIERSLSDTDPATVRRAVAEAMDVIVDQEAVVVPLAGVTGIYGSRQGVKGFTPHPSSIQNRWADVAWGER